MKIELSSIVENQLPQYVREEFPLAAEFLKQYYISDNANKIVQNIDEYVDLDTIFDIPEKTTLSVSIDTDDETIVVASTKGFPESYGLLKIDGEIITYKSKTSTSFLDCVRGFSGVNRGSGSQLIFTETSAETHLNGSMVYNVGAFFLKDFFFKIKQKIAPGFENRELYTDLNKSNFLKRIQDFYQTKGTKEAFRILFGALFGKDVDLILPRDRLFSASNAQFRVTKKLVVEALSGEPTELINSTIYQDTANNNFIAEASGTVTAVEKITRGENTYYLISLDSDYDRDIDVAGTIKSDFTIHPQTIILNDVQPGSTFIDVDSTIGFPNNGTLVSKTGILITYANKTPNQFLGCSNVTQSISKNTPIRLNTFVYGFTPAKETVKLRITGVIEEPQFVDNNYFYKPGEKIEIETLGYPSNDLKANEWVFNIPLTYIVSKISFESGTLYRIETIDANIFSISDKCVLTTSAGLKFNGTVKNIVNSKTIVALFDQQLDLTKSYTTIDKNISKASFTNFPYLSDYSTNVSNAYLDKDKNVYVLSPSIPSYDDILNTRTGITTISGTFTDEIFIQDHIYYTGDSVVYKPNDATNKLVNEGIYFVKKVDNDRIKLALSRENINQNVFVKFSGTVLKDQIQFFDLSNDNLTAKIVKPQNLIRKLSNPITSEKKTETIPGAVGILKNGVEILNYKSPNQIFYGPIVKVAPTSPGKDYDVINPPVLSVYDPIGTGATIHAHIRGNLKRIDLLYGGFDYLAEPDITFKGGNGRNAIAKPNLIEYDHIEYFDADTNVDIGTEIIGFSTFHKYRNAEEVIYNDNNGTTIGGLVSNERYFVCLKTASTLTLHKTYADAASGINTINLTSKGTGNQYFKSINKKKKVGSISIINSGENYENRKNYIVGINTYLGTFIVKEHKFKNGDRIYYTSNGNASTGLTNNTEYYVTVVDQDTLRLSQVNNSEPFDFYYRTEQYVGITSVSNSIQFLSYPPIVAEIKGRVGVASFNNIDYNAQIIPIFRGEFVDVTIQSGGSSYGSEDIINYNKQPKIGIGTTTFTDGSTTILDAAEIAVLVVNGKITNALITAPGKIYYAQPDLIVEGEGYNAVLTPVVTNGRIVDIKIISGGFGYKQGSTRVKIVLPGQGVKFETYVKPWRINNFARYRQVNYFKDEDGIVLNTKNSEGGLEYFNIYAPRKLRQASFAKKIVNGEVIYEQDLIVNQNGVEINSSSHSPIIGWAYDGNPIYGPYGYSSRFNATSIKQLSPGYTEKSLQKLVSENRPAFSFFPIGFFVEDYEYIGNGDLDVHNGRYCVTPEFPNGVYAYFATFETNVAQNNKFKDPKYPYIIGNTFYSQPIDFNLSNTSNQTEINLNDLDLVRNTSPYNLKSNNTIYKGVIQPYDIRKEVITIKATTPSKIDDIEVITAGDGYKVGQTVDIENDNSAKISKIEGKTVSNINSSIVQAKNTEIVTINNKIVGFATQPHTFVQNDDVTLSTYEGKKLNEKLTVERNELILASSILSSTVTGIVTYINVYGNLSDPIVRSNDIYQLGPEQVKVLNIDEKSSRVRILRAVNGTSGINSFKAGIGLTEISRKFTLSNKIGVVSSILNEEYYFNPIESVGVGTTAGVGVVSTLYFKNPGVGVTFLQIPTQSVYIPNHKLNTNDKIVYNAYSNTPISISTNGIGVTTLDKVTDLYVARFTSDLIGISSNPIGIGSSGQFVGLGNSIGLLYFVFAGTGEYHSFKTVYSPLKADLFKQEVTVSTASTHFLSVNDNIDLVADVGISTTIKIKYNDTNRRIVSKEIIISTIDTQNNILEFNNHQLKTGEKVIYQATSQLIGGLQNNTIYYVIVINDYKIKLASSRYNAINLLPIDLTSSGDGIISSINPLLNVEKNSTVVFDLSDSSLGFINNSFPYSAFGFNLYSDIGLTSLYYNNGDSPNSNVTGIGTIGVSATAKVTLVINDKTPENLYYDLVPLNDVNVPFAKSEKVRDTDQINSNSIKINNPSISNRFKVKSLTSNSFTFDLPQPVVAFGYTATSNVISYQTNSKTAFGGISDVAIVKNNPNNYTLPNVTKINSTTGSGGVLRVLSNDIGAIKSLNLTDIGFEYSVDESIKPKFNLPKLVKTEPLYALDSIKVKNIPIAYYTPPSLIVIDNYSNTAVPEVELDYKPDTRTVDIVKNTQEIRGTQPYIIPVNNSVGIAISSITFNPSTKNVVVVLDAQFSNPGDFPFENGSKVFIENVIVGAGEKGYNSSLYKYALFEIFNVDDKLGGIGASFTYSMQNYLASGETLGTYNSTQIQGSVVPQKYFPEFDITLKKNQFVPGELVFSGESTGTLIEHNFYNDYIKVLTEGNLKVGDKLAGQSSKTTIIVSEIIDFEAYAKIHSSSRVVEGWKTETGFFNNNLQRIHDNDYYQYFSYSLKSEVDYSKWNEAVSSLAHPAGFKKFSDLIVFSEVPSVGVSTDVVELASINDIFVDLNMNCIDNFALVRENSFSVDNILNSNEIYFDNKILQDYLESATNRVVPIDNVVVEFSNENEPDNYITLDQYNKDSFYYKKYFVSVLNKWNPEDSSLSQVTTLQNGTFAVINQYAEINVNSSLGYFDVDITDSIVELKYYPDNFGYSSYYVNSFSYEVGRHHLGVSTVNIGNIAKIEYTGQQNLVGVGTTTIVGISSSIRAAKLLVGFAYTNNSHYELDEINIIHDGTNIYSSSYGELQIANTVTGIGTYNVYYLGDKINVDLIPNNVGTGLSYRTNIVVQSIGNTSFTGIGSTTIGNNSIFSNEVTTTGISTEVLRYSVDNCGSYSIVSIANTTNSTYSIVEFVSMYNPVNNEVYYVEYGNVNTNNHLGIISSYVKNNDVIVEFKPSASANYRIRSLNNIVGQFQTVSNVAINTSFNFGADFAYYEATLFGSKKSFELLNETRPIFKQTFDGSSNVGVSTTESVIRIPNHYFVTGEEVEYKFDGSPIGIGTTVVGVGTTNILPSKVYIVKVDDTRVKVSAAASYALASTPKTLELKNVGVGTQHTFNSTSQNNRALITLDNIIQSPIISVAKTTLLNNTIGFFNSKITLQNPSDIVSGDLLKIDDELVKVIATGIGSTNVCLVDRAKLGTGLAKHNQNTIITKVKGNYNIQDNIFYYEAPPFSSDQEYSYKHDFRGRVFLRSAVPDTSNNAYYDNYLFDDISPNFNGISKTFSIKSNKNNVINVDDRGAIILINNVFQSVVSDYDIVESSGISSITFTGNATSATYDVNNASIPRGGIILSVGSTSGLGYQPLVSAGGTAVVSAGGTIQSISIGNSGSGYRSGLQVVKVGVQTESTGTPKIEFIGIASVSNGNVVSVAITNPGIGYTAFPVKYITQTSQVVSAGSSILPLNIISGITTNDIISVGLAITNAKIVGIATTTITIGSAFTASSQIAAGTTSSFKTYNPPKVIFDDPLSYSNLQLSYASGSSGNGVEATVSIVVGQGSSVINFELDNSGYGYKVGDELTVGFGGTVGIPTDSTKPFTPFKLKVNSIFNDDFSGWVVGDLQKLDSFDSLFNGTRKIFQLKLNGNPTSFQKKPGSKVDLKNNLLIFINDVLQVPGESYTFTGGSVVSFVEAPQAGDKSKVLFYKGTTDYDTVLVDILEEVKIGDRVTINSENSIYQQEGRLITEINSPDVVSTYLYNGQGISDDETLVRPATICRQTEDIIYNGQIIGKNRTIYEPIITPASNLISPISLGTSEIFIETFGLKYDLVNQYVYTEELHKNIRIVSQDDNNLKYETIRNATYEGDFGYVTGIKTAQIGVGSTGVVFQLYIPNNSPVITENYAVNKVSGIRKGYYFKINNTNIGNGIISLDNDESQIGVGTTFIDNVYKAYSVCGLQTYVPGVGITTVLQVTAKVDRYVNVVGSGFSDYYGQFSWGRLHSFSRPNPKVFTLNPAGLSTSPILQSTGSITQKLKITSISISTCGVGTTGGMSIEPIVEFTGGTSFSSEYVYE